MQPGVSGAYGNSPDSLTPAAPAAPPIPDLGNVSGAVSQAMTPAAPAAGGDALDQLFASWDQQAAAPAATDPADVPMMPGEALSPAGQAAASANMVEQIREAPARFRNAFTVTGPESVAVLKQYPGLFQDVRENDGVIEVKRNGKKGWSKLDKDQIEFIGDTLDMSRGVLESVIQQGATALGTRAGAALGLTGGPGGGIAGGMTGSAVGNAVGGVLAKKAGDVVAQGLLGIPRDPNRSELSEDLVTAAFSGGFGAMGKYFTDKAARNKALQGEAQKTVEHAMEQVTSTMDDVKTVQDSGIILGEHGNFHLDPQQAAGAGVSPELNATAKSLSTEESFRNFRRHVGDSIKNAYDSVANTLGAMAGKGATLADDFQLTAKDVRTVEGKLIGNFRSMADQKLLNQPQATPRFFQTLQAMAQEMPQDVDQFALSAGLTNSQAKQMQGLVKGYAQRVTKGAMTFEESELIRKQLQGIIDSNVNTSRGKSVAIKLFDLRNAITEDGIDMIEQALPANQVQQFAASKAKYRTIMDATAQLGSLLETENISKNELIGKLFEGKGSYKFAQSAKTLIQETNPKLWDQLSSEYFMKLRNDATDMAKRTVDYAGMSKKWNNLDPRLQQDLLNSTGIPAEGMNALLRLGTRVQGTTFEALPRDPQLKGIKSLIKTAFTMWGGGATAKGGTVGNLLDGMGKDQAVAKWLKNGGAEEVLNEMPGLKSGKVAAIRDWVMNWQPVKQAARLNSINTKNSAINVMTPAPVTEEPE